MAQRSEWQAVEQAGKLAFFSLLENRAAFFFFQEVSSKQVTGGSVLALYLCCTPRTNYC